MNYIQDAFATVVEAYGQEAADGLNSVLGQLNSILGMIYSGEDAYGYWQRVREQGVCYMLRV